MCTRTHAVEPSKSVSVAFDPGRAACKHQACMSCSSCSGSVNCQQAETRPQPTASTLLSKCQKLCAKGEVMAETDEMLQVFNALGFAVACGRARSLEALATVFNQLGAHAFTDVCASLLRLDCTGDLVALAYAACKSHPSCFHRRLLDKADLGELVEEVNLAARRHELVPGNGSVGRAKVPITCDGTQDAETIGIERIHSGSEQKSDCSCSLTDIVITSTGRSREDVTADLERWWWIGPWVGTVVLGWTVAMWWTQRRPPRSE
eukprot:COSAG02_NODE_864_length_16407_cov_4.535197_7_plen_263_part_00